MEELIKGVLQTYDPTRVRFVHGACVGTDAEAGALLVSWGFDVHAVIPSDRSRVDPHWQQQCTTYEKMPPGTDYRDRNRRILDRADYVLLAFPDHAEHDERSKRSGTWMTVRMGFRLGMTVNTYIVNLETPHDIPRVV